MQSAEAGYAGMIAALNGVDVQHGLNEWRGIQDAVQLTFKAFFEALRTQGEAIKTLERSRDELALSLRNELAASLTRKANVGEVSGRLAEVEAQLSRKADAVDLERRAVRTEVEASMRTQMADVLSLLKSKSEDSEFRAWRESCERQIAALRADVTRLATGLEDLKVSLASKAGAAEVAAALAAKADAADVDTRLRDKASRKIVTEALATKADAVALDTGLAEVRAAIADTEAALGRKADAGRCEELVHRQERLRARVEADSDTTQAALRALGATFDTALADANRRSEEAANMAAGARAALGEREEALRRDLGTRLAELEDVHGAALARKADSAEVARVLAEVRAEMKGVGDALATRASNVAVASLEAQVAATSHLAARLDALQRDVANKMSADRAVYATLEGKANIEDVNKALLEVCKELEGRAAVEVVEACAARTEALTAAVSTANLSARWLWKSGRTKAGGAVPWDVQAVNADPSSFVWEGPGKTLVTTVIPGLYEVSLGFFSRKRPIVQLMVNGEPVLTATGASSSVVHHASGSAGGAAAAAQLMPSVLQSQGGQPPPPAHSAGNVAGLTAREFLSLPAHARIAVTFQGEAERTEGFLMLRKL